MALVRQTLTTQLLALYSNPPTATDLVPEKWAHAIYVYLLPIMPPSTNVANSYNIFVAALGNMGKPTQAAVALTSALQIYAAYIALGMNNAVIVSTPPPLPPNIAAVFGAAYQTHLDAAGALSLVLDTWFRTGTVVISGAPPVPWS